MLTRAQVHARNQARSLKDDQLAVELAAAERSRAAKPIITRANADWLDALRMEAAEREILRGLK